MSKFATPILRLHIAQQNYSISKRLLYFCNRNSARSLVLMTYVFQLDKHFNSYFFLFLSITLDVNAFFFFF